MNPRQSAQVALVHDYLLVMRGAERVFRTMSECWPQAPVSTLLYDEASMGAAFAGREITTSYLQRLPVRQRGFRALLPFYPRAVEHLYLPPASLVVSSSSAFAHGVRPPQGAVHLCYCHSPFRYVWHERDRAMDEIPAPLRPIGGRVLDRVRNWDVKASRRVDRYLANSELTRRRIADFYGRESVVLHPPVELERFAPSDERGDYFLLVAELVRHKNAHVALAAAERAGVAIKVIGDGPEASSLRGKFRRVEFLGRIGDAKLADLYAGAKALVMPAVEEFGIVAVEAHAAGRPVLAANAGGALEIVIDGQTGAFAPVGDVEATAEAMREVDWDGFDPAVIRARADHFSPARFRERLIDHARATLAAV